MQFFFLAIFYVNRFLATLFFPQAGEPEVLDALCLYNNIFKEFVEPQLNAAIAGFICYLFKYFVFVFVLFNFFVNRNKGWEVFTSSDR